MSKTVKVLLLPAYTILVIHYFLTSIYFSAEDIDLDYEAGVPGTNYIRLKNRYENKYRKRPQYVFKKPVRFATDYKYILLHKSTYLHTDTPLSTFGQRSFIENKCKYINCFISKNINMFPDVRHYDAILINIEDMMVNNIKARDPYQKYIFLASGASERYPLCNGIYNNYFNLTWTYKLKSDVPWTYIKILDTNGMVVGPNENMLWIDSIVPTPVEVTRKLKNKKKAVAGFMSECTNKAGEDVANEIVKELTKLGLTVDILGQCGNKPCPKNRFDECLSLLQTNYYFYLSFENVLSEDYVTDKVLHPLKHYAVPIVYGGADYSRFLPPGSYIDARLLNASQVADEVHKAINTPSVYLDYFKWHNYYTFEENHDFDVCKLCQILNEEANKKYVYEDFLYWWNGSNITECFETQTNVSTNENIANKKPEPAAPLDEILHPREYVIDYDFNNN